MGVKLGRRVGRSMCTPSDMMSGWRMGEEGEEGECTVNIGSNPYI